MVATTHCPRCRGAQLRPYLDGDSSCWVCGHVEYATTPLPKFDERKDHQGDSRRMPRLTLLGRTD